MKKKLNDKLTIYKTNNFPKNSGLNSSKLNEIVLGIGGNIGDVKKTFDKLFLSLKGNKRLKVIITSNLLKNPPFGFLEQNYFLNGIIVLKSNLGINDFFNMMQRYEYRFKRTRSFKDAPRTLDIDIIFYKNKKINTKKLIIPHKDWENRESVVIPLNLMKKTNLKYKI